METRANFVLIGAFTLAGILGVLGFFIWLAQYEVDRQYDYYDILFSDVSGLSQAADVRFNGLSVGQVVSLKLADDDPSLVRVRIEVRGGTPVKADTTVQLQVLGVTGISYVSLSGGTMGAPPPPPGSEGIPALRAERSIVERITEDAPTLLRESVSLLRELRGFASAENRNSLSNILANVDAASARLETALSDFSEISTTVAAATGQISAFTDRLGPVADSLQQALEQSEALIDAATGAFRGAQTTLTGADTLIRQDATVTLAEVNGLVVELRANLARISQEVSGVIGTYGTTAQLANQRLTELEGTLDAIDAVMAEANVTLDSVDSASIAFEELVEGEGGTLVTEMRTAVAGANRALASINRVLDEDLPAIIAEVKAAVESASAVVTEVGADVTDVSRRIAPLSDTAQAALQAAVETLHTTNRTLEHLDGAMAGAERTLSAAETTFNSVNSIIEEEARPTAADIRNAAARVNAAVDQISADLPAASADLRATIAQAGAVMDRVSRLVDGAAGPVTGFAESGLPAFTQLARELRELVGRLDRIAGRLERDPARFILGGQAPDYRR